VSCIDIVFGGGLRRAQGFPTLLLFAPGNKRAQTPEVYKGARNSDAIAQWALKVPSSSLSPATR
jgi:hypothetical protein